MMKDHSIIYVEGISASGKTTSLNLLKNLFSERIDVISEYINTVEGQKAEISHDPGFFRKNDENKWSAAVKSSKKYAFVDRGHLSTIIYNLADFKINKNIDAINILDWYFDTILENRMLPDCYIFLETAPAVSLSRRTKELLSHNMWDKIEAMQFANEYYLKLMKSYEPQIPIIHINTDTITPEGLLQRVVSEFFTA